MLGLAAPAAAQTIDSEEITEGETKTFTVSGIPSSWTGSRIEVHTGGIGNITDCFSTTLPGGGHVPNWDVCENLSAEIYNQNTRIYTFELQARADSVDDPNETITITLSDSDDSSRSVTFTITIREPFPPGSMPQIVLSQDEFVVDEPQADNCSDDKVGDEKTWTDITLRDGSPGVRTERNYGPVLTTETYKVSLDRSPGPGKVVSVEIWEPTDLDRPDVGRFHENARIHGIGWPPIRQGRISIDNSPVLNQGQPVGDGSRRHLNTYLTFTDKNWNRAKTVTINIHCAQHDVTTPLPIWHFAFRHNTPGWGYPSYMYNRKADNSPNNTSLKIAQVRVADKTEPDAITGNVDGNLVLDPDFWGYFILSDDDEDEDGYEHIIGLDFRWNNPDNSLHNDYDDANEKFAGFRVTFRTLDPPGHAVQEEFVRADFIIPGDAPTTASWRAELEAIGYDHRKRFAPNRKYEWSVVPVDRHWNDVEAERVTRCVLMTGNTLDLTTNPTCPPALQGEGASAPAVYVPDTAVANVQITAVDDASASVTWDAVPHATSYEVSWDGSGSQNAITGILPSVRGTTTTIQHNAEEAMTLTVTVTPEYVDGNDQVVSLPSLAGTATIDVGPSGESIDSNGGTNGGDGDSVRADSEAVDLPDPVAHWDFDNDAVDSVGSSDGTVSGGAAFTANEDGSGVGSHALSLDGSDDHVNLSSHVSSFPLGDATRSVSGWFKADAGSQGQTFLSYGPNVAGKRFSIAADRTQAVVGVSGHGWGVNGLELEEGWHHIAVTYAGGDSDDILIYLDGVLQSASTLAGSSQRLDTRTGPAVIGQNVSGVRHYAGSIDDVRLYDVALSAEQVLALFEEHPQTVLAEDNLDEPEPSEQSIEADDEAVDLPDPVAHWGFDNDAVDGAGSSHGTVSGGAAFTTNEDGEGVGSHALSLDGSNDYVDLDLHISKFPLGDSARSVSGWFKADTGNQGQTFFSYGPNVAGKRFSIAADRTQAVVGVSGYAWGVRNLSLTDGWHHIAVTFAGGDAKVFSIYLDGVLQSAQLLGGFRRELDTKSGPASIGRSATGTKHYAGSIDDVRLYDVELSAEQVRALFDKHPQL